jgi:hypothetical protein
VRIPILYVPLCSTTRFWLPGSRLGGWPLLQSVALCSQTVALDFSKPKELQIVHKLLQSVAKRKSPLKNKISPSSTASAIALLIEGAVFDYKNLT